MRGSLRARHRPLAARLRAHVVSEFDRADHEWWVPPRTARPLSGATTSLHVVWWRLTARHRRTAELAQIVEHLAVLVGAGCSLSVAIDRVLERAQGAVIDDLATVAGWMRDGQPVVRALRRWAMTAACDTAGRLASAASAAASAGELAQRLTALADALHVRAHDERLAAMQRATRVAWTASLLGGVATLVAALP